MNIAGLLKSVNLEKVRLNVGIANLEIEFSDADKNAAWEMYIEMLTRIVTQPLPDEVGDEKTALNSVYSLFPTVREILRRQGRETVQFTKIAIPVLNQVVRPFTAKWHKGSLSGAFDDPEEQKRFRRELDALQVDLRNYNRLLAKIAEVEDLTELENIKEDNDG